MSICVVDRYDNYLFKQGKITPQIGGKFIGSAGALSFVQLNSKQRRRLSLRLLYGYYTSPRKQRGSRFDRDPQNHFYGFPPGEFQNKNLSRIGYPVNQQWGYVAERLFVDQEDIDNSPEQFNGFSSTNSYLPGDIKYTDLNQDGVVNELDQAPIGKPNVPEIVYGFGVSAVYKNFDF